MPAVARYVLVTAVPSLVAAVLPGPGCEVAPSAEVGAGADSRRLRYGASFAVALVGRGAWCGEFGVWDAAVGACVVDLEERPVFVLRHQRLGGEEEGV
jgi:hypothetical protein